jgi:hypothetical protein
MRLATASARLARAQIRVFPLQNFAYGCFFLEFTALSLSPSRLVSSGRRSKSLHNHISS